MEKQAEIILNELILNDGFWFWFFQASLFSLFVWSLFKDLIRPKGWYVTRNSSNQKAFLLTFTTLCAAAFAFVTQVSPVPNNGKTLPIIFDFAIIAYLCFFSSWFTNRVVVVRVWFENKKW